MACKCIVCGNEDQAQVDSVLMCTFCIQASEVARETQKNWDKLTGLLKEARQFMQNVFDADGGCDHSVGICECGDRMLAEKMDVALGVKKPPPQQYPDPGTGEGG